MALICQASWHPHGTKVSVLMMGGRACTAIHYAASFINSLALVTSRAVDAGFGRNNGLVM